jgi:hypothetical protein
VQKQAALAFISETIKAVPILFYVKPGIKFAPFGGADEPTPPASITTYEGLLKANLPSI